MEHLSPLHVLLMSIGLAAIVCAGIYGLDKLLFTNRKPSRDVCYPYAVIHADTDNNRVICATNDPKVAEIKKWGAK